MLDERQQASSRRPGRAWALKRAGGVDGLAVVVDHFLLEVHTERVQHRSRRWTEKRAGRRRRQDECAAVGGDGMDGMDGWRRGAGGAGRPDSSSVVARGNREERGTLEGRARTAFPTATQPERGAIGHGARPPTPATPVRRSLINLPAPPGVVAYYIGQMPPMANARLVVAGTHSPFRPSVACLVLCLCVSVPASLLPLPLLLLLLLWTGT